MEKWNQDKRRDVVMVDIDQLVPSDHIHARRNRGERRFC